MASFAQFYSANLATEVKKGMRQKVLNGGWPHRPPRGYVLRKRPDGTGNEIEIHPKDGPLMRRAFELYGSGWHSMRTVAAMLAREGLLSRNGGPIPQAHFRRLLASSFYVGKVRWHDLECAGKHVPLVSAELFEKVQEMIHQRYRNPGIKTKIAEIRTQQTTLAKAVERTSVSPERLAATVARTLQLATSLWDLYEQFDDTKRAELLRSVFKAIVLDHNGVVGVTLKPPFDELMKPSALAQEQEAHVAQRLLDAA